jgi:Cu+-exporting ATPase
MDTMRKASRLDGVVKCEDYLNGKPAYLRTEGQVADFMEHYNKISRPERIQNIYAVIALLASIGVAVFAYMRHGMSTAVQIFSTTLLVAVPASFFVSITRPMAVVERRLHRLGAVLCGWTGIKSLGKRALFPVKDEDLFPKGSSKLNGVKFYSKRNPDEVVAFSTSLITASGSTLTPVFQQLRKSRNCMEFPVKNFRNYGDGGIGGEVQGQPVLLGNHQFLLDMGVEIPEGTMVNQAVYAAVDGELCAVYAISYAKMRSSSAGLVSLCSSRKLSPILVGRDFMITEDLIRNKFGVNTRRIAFPPYEVRKDLAAKEPEEEATALALMTKEGLLGMSFAITGARALRTASIFGVTIHMIAGILGLLIVALLAVVGAEHLLTAENLMLFELLWLIPGLLITEWTRNA